MARPKADAFDVDTHERILVAAEQIFAQRGFDRARLEDIAKEAGIRRPSLLYHFGTKGRLYESVIERVMGELGATVVAAMSEKGAYIDRLQLIVAAFTGFLQAKPSAGPLILREIIDGQGPGREMLLATADPILNNIEAFLREVGQDQFPADFPVRQALLQITSGALVQYAAGPLQTPLWGPADHTPILVQRLFAR